MIKKIWLNFYNYLLSIYIIICTSFFFNQYLEVVQVNVSQYSDFVYFVKDNIVLIVLFLLVFFSILSNLYYISEYWIFTTKEELNIKRIVGYKYNEIVNNYYSQFISHFFIVFCIAILTCIPVLHYFDLPIIEPILISCLGLGLTLSLLIISMISYCLSKYNKGSIFNFKYTKKVVIVFQFSISLMLIFISLILFSDINQEISPYRNYIDLNEAWILKAHFETVEESIEKDKNPENYRGDILKKIENLYSQYKDNILVYYVNIKYNDDIGRTIYLNKKTLEMNNIDTAIFTPFLNSKEVPIILSNSFHEKYSIGEIIKGNNVDYIVAKILEPGEILKILGPDSFVENSSEEYNFALFDNQFISSELYLSNSNFLNTIFFINISKDEISKINEYINENTFTYTYESIKGTQQEYYLQKNIALSGYLIVGSVNILFSILGLICIIYVDINSKEIEFSVLKVVGYTNKSIYSNYLLSISIIFLFSFTNALFLSFVSLKFSALITSIIAIIVLIIYIVVSIISIFFINNIKAVEIIGGENV